LRALFFVGVPSVALAILLVCLVDMEALYVGPKDAVALPEGSAQGSFVVHWHPNSSLSFGNSDERQIYAYKTILCSEVQKRTTTELILGRMPTPDDPPVEIAGVSIYKNKENCSFVIAYVPDPGTRYMPIVRSVAHK
jgi:hypothetical protein